MRSSIEVIDLILELSAVRLTPAWFYNSQKNIPAALLFQKE